MSIPGAGSGVERHGKRTTGMRQIPATAWIATAVVIAIAITPPAFARVNTGGAGNASGSNSDASHQSSYSASRVSNENVSGAPRPSGAGSAPEFSSSGGARGAAIEHAQFDSSSGGEVVTWISSRASVMRMSHFGATSFKQTASHRLCTHRN